MGLVTLEDVRDPEAYEGEDEVKQGTGQGFAVLWEAKVGIVDVFQERRVRAEVYLVPVCYIVRHICEQSVEWKMGMFLLTDSQEYPGGDAGLDDGLKACIVLL
jgi:hypothetical protein